MIFYRVTVTYTDGTEETFSYVAEARIVDGTLKLLEPRSQFSGNQTMIAAFPLVNIRKWTKAEM